MIHGFRTAETLKVRRDETTISLVRNNLINTADDPVRPPHLTEFARIRNMCRVDIGQVEIALTADEGVAEQFRNGLFVHGGVEERVFEKGGEPGCVGFVACAEGDPVCVDDYDGRPGGDVVFGEVFWVVGLQFGFEFWDDGEEFIAR